MTVKNKFLPLSSHGPSILSEAGEEEQRKRVDPSIEPEETGDEDTKNLKTGLQNARRRKQILRQVQLISRKLGKDWDPEIQQAVLGAALYDALRRGDQSTQWSHAEFTGTELWKLYNDRFPNNPILPTDEKKGSDAVNAETQKAIEKIRYFLKEYGSSWSDFVSRPTEHSKKSYQSYIKAKKDFDQVKSEYDDINDKIGKCTINNIIDNIMKAKKQATTQDEIDNEVFLTNRINDVRNDKGINPEAVQRINQIINQISFNTIRISGKAFIGSGGSKLSDGQIDFLQEKNLGSADAMTMLSALLTRPDLFSGEQVDILKNIKLDFSDAGDITLDEFRDILTDQFTLELFNEMSQVRSGDLQTALKRLQKNTSDLLKYNLEQKMITQDEYNDLLKSIGDLPKRAMELYPNTKEKYMKALESLKTLYVEYGSQEKTALLQKLTTAKKNGDLKTLQDEYRKVGGSARFEDIIDTTREAVKEIGSQNLDPEFLKRIKIGKIDTLDDLNYIKGLLEKFQAHKKKQMDNVKESVTANFDSYKTSKDPIVALSATVVEKLADTNVDTRKLKEGTLPKYELGTVALGRTIFNLVAVISGNPKLKIEIKKTDSDKEDPFTSRRSLEELLPAELKQKKSKMPAVAEDIFKHLEQVICEAEGAAPPIQKKVDKSKPFTRGGRSYPSWMYMIQSIKESPEVRDHDRRIRKEYRKDRETKKKMLVRLYLDRISSSLDEMLNDPDSGKATQDYIIAAFEKYGSWFDDQKNLIMRNKKRPVSLPLEETEKEVFFDSYLTDIVDRLNAFRKASYERTLMDLGEESDGSRRSLYSIENSGFNEEQIAEYEMLRDTLEKIYQYYAEDMISPTSKEQGLEPFKRIERASTPRNKIPAHYELWIYIPKREFLDLSTSDDYIQQFKVVMSQMEKDLMAFMQDFDAKQNPKDIMDMYKLAKTKRQAAGKFFTARDEISQMVDQIIETPAEDFSEKELYGYIQKNQKMPPGMIHSGNSVFNGPRLFKLIQGELEKVSRDVKELNVTDRTYVQLANDVTSTIFKNLKKGYDIDDLNLIHGKIDDANPELPSITSATFSKARGRSASTPTISKILKDESTIIKLGSGTYHVKRDTNGDFLFNPETGEVVLNQPPPPELMKKGVGFTVIHLPEPQAVNVNGRMYRAYIMVSNGTGISVDRVAGAKFRWNTSNIEKYERMTWEQHKDDFVKYGITDFEEFQENMAKVPIEKKVEMFTRYFKKEIESEKDMKYEMYITIPRKTIKGIELPSDKNDPTYQETLTTHEGLRNAIEEQLVSQFKNPVITGYVSSVPAHNKFTSEDLIDQNVNFRENVSVDLPNGTVEVTDFDPETGTVSYTGPRGIKVNVGDRFGLHNVDFDINDSVLRTYQKADKNLWKNDFYRAEANRIKFGLPDSIAGEEGSFIRDKFDEYMTKVYKEYIDQKSKVYGGPIGDDFLAARAQMIKKKEINFIGKAMQLEISPARAQRIFKKLVLLYDPAIVSSWGDPYMSRDEWKKKVFGGNTQLLGKVIDLKSEPEKKLFATETEDESIGLIRDVADSYRQENEPYAGVESTRATFRVFFNWDLDRFWQYALRYKFGEDPAAMAEWARIHMPMFLQEKDRRGKLYGFTPLSQEQEEEEEKEAKWQQEQEADASKGWQLLDIDDVVERLNKRFEFEPDPNKSFEENEEKRKEVEHLHAKIEQEALNAWEKEDETVKQNIYNLYLEDVEPTLREMAKLIVECVVSAPIKNRVVRYLEEGDEVRMAKLYNTTKNHCLACVNMTMEDRKLLFEYFINNMV